MALICLYVDYFLLQILVCLAKPVVGADVYNYGLFHDNK